MPRRPALKKRADNSTAPCSSKPKEREAPKTPPDQQLVASQPSAPRKRRAQNNKDQASIEPSAKRIAIDNASDPFLSTDSHDDTPGKVVISPTGTICKCHLKPGAICWHVIHEPHVSNPKARARYERLAPAKQAMQRVRANQAKNKSNAMKELKIDVAVVNQEGDEWLKKQNLSLRKRRTTKSGMIHVGDGQGDEYKIGDQSDGRDKEPQDDDAQSEEDDEDSENSDDDDDDDDEDQDSDYVEDLDDREEEIIGRETDLEDDEEISVKKCEDR